MKMTDFNIYTHQTFSVTLLKKPPENMKWHGRFKGYLRYKSIFCHKVALFYLRKK